MASLPSSRGEKPARWTAASPDGRPACHDRALRPQAARSTTWSPGGTGQRSVRASGRKARARKPGEHSPTAAWPRTLPLHRVTAGTWPSELRGSYMWVTSPSVPREDPGVGVGKDTEYKRSSLDVSGISDTMCLKTNTRACFHGWHRHARPHLRISRF